MGCGASKESTAVSPSVVDQKLNPSQKSAEKTTSAPSNNTLSKSVIPSIAQSNKTNKIGQSIAFEIPIDDLFDDSKKPVVQRTSSGKLTQLPALSLSQQDIQAKLANTEERWKDLATGDNGKNRRKKGMRPKLKSRKQEDPETLKMRLHEREVAAQQNREKEITKLQLKLARQEEHARKVLERKRAMGGEDGELRLSYGGEDGKGLAELADEAESRQNSSSTTSSSENLKVDSGKGNGASRGSSGRSQTTDTTEVDEHVVPVANPIKAAAKGFGGLAPRANRAIA